MNGQFQANDIEIVGFNGAPLVACGHALPVVRRKSDGQFALLALRPDDGSRNWYSEAEAMEDARTQRWTVLERPLAVPSSTVDPDGHLPAQLLVVYVNEDLLYDAMNERLSGQRGADQFRWVGIKDGPQAVRAASGSASIVESLLNSWAQSAIDRFDRCFDPEDFRRFKPIADFALCAAQTGDLRWKSYLRYALSQEPERVRRTYENFIRREFPKCDWDSFVRQYGSVASLLRARRQKVALPNYPERVLDGTWRPRHNQSVKQDENTCNTCRQLAAGSRRAAIERAR